MRYATANNTGTHCYSDLLDSCRHSRLKAALAGGLPAAPRAYHAASTSPAFHINEATKAYLWVAGMSVVSLLSIVVSGTINA